MSQYLHGQQHSVPLELCQKQAEIAQLVSTQISARRNFSYSYSEWRELQ